MIYIVGDITKEEVKEATKTLLPDEVEYDSEGEINKLDEKFKDKKVVYIWWD
jgi:predicted Zn-dependent peptidase